MILSIFMFGFALASALSSGFLIGRSVVARGGRPSIQSVLLDEENQNFLFKLLKNGVGIFVPVAHLLMTIPPVKEWADRAKQCVELKGYETNPESLLSVVVAASVAAALILGIFTASWIGLCVGAIGAVVIALWWVKTQLERQRNNAREAIPDALNAMSVCFRSGLSLRQTLSQVSRETQEPLSNLFRKAAHLLETGSSTPVALEVFENVPTLPELAFVAVALDVQHQAGGSIQTVLESARDSVMGQIELLQSLRVQTAQAKFSSRIVTFMPFALLGLLSLLSPGFIDPFFSSILGFIVFLMAIAMEVIGIVIVQKMLDVDLS